MPPTVAPQPCQPVDFTVLFGPEFYCDIVEGGGQLLYLGYAKKEVNCARCHGPAGEGGQDAPDIRKAFEEYSETDILFFIENGKGDGKNAMPALQGKITEREIQHLLKFLRTLKPQANQPAQPTR